MVRQTIDISLSAGKANKYRDQDGYKSQDKYEAVFFYPL